MNKRFNLLVVVILSMLAGGLLVPAGERLRQFSLEVQGMCKYAQIGLALHNYYDTHSSFPPGTLPNPNLLPEQRLSWLVAILPFVEKATLAEQINKEGAWEAAESRPAVNTTIETYRCAANPNQPVPNMPGLTHYVGIAGIGLNAATLPVHHAKAGFFGHDRQLTLQDVKDGTSNTMWGIGTAAMNGPWAAGGPATVREVLPSLKPYVGPHRPFGGVHRGTVRVGMADGSVKNLKESLSPDIFEALATVAGGETLHGDF